MKPRLNCRVPVLISPGTGVLNRRLRRGAERLNDSLHVAVKVRVRTKHRSSPKGQFLEAGWKLCFGWHFRPLSQKRDHAELSGEGTFEFEPNKVSRIVEPSPPLAGCVKPVLPDQHNHRVAS